ncbi:hypothetical protein XENORESO_013476 [Xenotaenia resolanae]|uniref:Uncharacterized protein n=1 Tax=Xenotaenia resolanae TaxID=208358 RepID=A0ABV0WQY5_9TELE
MYSRSDTINVCFYLYTLTSALPLLSASSHSSIIPIWHHPHSHTSLLSHSISIFIVMITRYQSPHHILTQYRHPLFYIEPHLPLNTSCIDKYRALFGKKAVDMNVSAGVEAIRVL